MIHILIGISLIDNDGHFVFCHFCALLHVHSFERPMHRTENLLQEHLFANFVSIFQPYRHEKRCLVFWYGKDGAGAEIPYAIENLTGIVLADVGDSLEISLGNSFL